MVFGLFGVYWVMPKTVIKVFASREGQLGHHRNGIIWKAVFTV